MSPQFSDCVIFSGRSHRGLAEKIALELGTALGRAEVESFPDGEIGVQILENVRGRDAFVIQTVANDPNLYLMELLIMVDALKRASAASIVVVVPYFGYSRQDRRGKGRDPITAKLVADLMETAGVDHVITLDLHSEQIEGFFDVPVDNVRSQGVFLDAVEGDSVVVAPDVGSIKIAERFAKRMGCELAIVDKRRASSGDVSARALIGSVTGKEVLIVDDMISTGKTIELASQICLENGATGVSGAVVHMLKVPELSSMKRLLVSDSIPVSDKTLPPNIQIVSIAPLIAQVISCVLGGESVSELYKN